MERTGMIGVDLGKRSFQFRGVREDWSAVNKHQKLSTIPA